MIASNKEVVVVPLVFMEFWYFCLFLYTYQHMYLIDLYCSTRTILKFKVILIIIYEEPKTS